MKAKGILLFLALLLPVCIFLFLKFFGKNEFQVAPLYMDESPAAEGCVNVSIPYRIADSIRERIILGDHELVILADNVKERGNVMRRLREYFSQDPVAIQSMQDKFTDVGFARRCIFFLKEPFDLVLVDKEGQIRGQYNSREREEVDRLQVEVSIILRKF